MLYIDFNGLHVLLRAKVAFQIGREPNEICVHASSLSRVAWRTLRDNVFDTVYAAERVGYRNAVAASQWF